MKITKQTTIGYLLAFSALVMPALSVAAGSQLQNVTISEAAAGKTAVNLDFSTPVTIPQAFVLENPPRLVFDFPDVAVLPGARRNNAGAGSVKSIYAANNKGLARVVIAMNSFADYTIQPHGDDLVLVFDGQAAATVPRVPSAQNVANRPAANESYNWYQDPSSQGNHQAMAQPKHQHQHQSAQQQRAAQQRAQQQRAQQHAAHQRAQQQRAVQQRAAQQRAQQQRVAQQRAQQQRVAQQLSLIHI